MKRAVIIAGYIAAFWIKLPGLLFLIGLAIDIKLRLPAPPASLRIVFALIAAYSAQVLLRSIIQLIRRGDGLPISHLPPANLVASGIYARCRHPIYVAYNATFAASAIAFGSWGVGLGGGTVLLLAWIAYALLFEEPRLRARFGKAYAEYAARTPLIPGMR